MDKILSLFDGMACGFIAMQNAGVEIDSYDAFEIDKYAIKTATHNFPMIKEHGDVFTADFTQFEGVDWLIGGSPCQCWTVCQKKNRETTASGVGWELFQQYVRALREAKPRYFIYENNKSMSNAIRDSIREAFGFEEVCINSALVSAQNRQRYYWVGMRNDDGTYSRVNIDRPVDRGVLLRDVLENRSDIRHEPVCVASRGRRVDGDSTWRQQFEVRGYKTNALTTVQKDNMVTEPVLTTDGKARTIKAQYFKTAIANLVDPHHYPVSGAAELVKSPPPAKPCRVGTYPNKAKNKEFDSQQYRVYLPEGKSVTLCGNGGGVGAKTGLYCFPTDGCYATACEWDNSGKPTKARSCADGKIYRVYEVANGLITVLDRQYPLAVADGYWIIRKLTVRECARLQTVPEWYEFPVSDSQAYKLLGNGWTCDVITHLIRSAHAKEQNE